MALIANFSYTLAGLTVNFTDGSSNTGGPAITVWDWNFGDGTTSTDQNPIKTYTASGIYGVILNITADTETAQAIRYIFIVTTAGVIPVPIIEMVWMKIPPTLFATQNIITYIQRYQLMLKDAPENEISIDNVFNETSWPSLYNVLIAELVVLEAIRQMASVFASSGTLISSQLLSTETTTTLLEPQLKMVKTGPAEAEWFNKVEDIAKLTEQYSNYFKSIFGSAGLMGELQKSVCMLARSLDVYLPTICGEADFSFPNLSVVTPEDLKTVNNFDPDHNLTNI